MMNIYEYKDAEKETRILILYDMIEREILAWRFVWFLGFMARYGWMDGWLFMHAFLRYGLISM